MANPGILGNCSLGPNVRLAAGGSLARGRGRDLGLSPGIAIHIPRAGLLLFDPAAAYLPSLQHQQMHFGVYCRYRRIVRRERPAQRQPKPRLGSPISHPAKQRPPILDAPPRLWLDRRVPLRIHLTPSLARQANRSRTKSSHLPRRCCCCFPKDSLSQSLFQNTHPSHSFYCSISNGHSLCFSASFHVDIPSFRTNTRCSELATGLTFRHARSLSQHGRHSPRALSK